MTAELSKAEKERLLDEKIKMMKARNALMEQRQREVDRDKKIAESSKSSITVAPKPKYETEPVTPPDRLARPSGTAGASGSTGKPRRQSDDSHFDPQRSGAPQASGATSSVRPSRLQSMAGDPDGPPPDPGYRFLADRMRDDDQASGAQGDSGSAGSKKNSRDPPPSSSRAANNRSLRGGSGGKPSRDRGQLHNNKDHHPYRTPLMEEEDDVILVSESDRRGNTVTYHHHQHIDNTTPSKLMDDHNNTRRSGAGSAGKRADPRSTNNMLAASGSPSSKPQTPQSASKLKSLFDDDDEEFYFPERWKGKEHHPKLFDAGRKIEQTAGGKLMVTRTIDPVARLESEFSVPIHSNKSEQQKELYAKRHDGKDDNTVIMSEIEWQCSDPACRNLNPPRTANCARCRLAFSMSNEYKNSLACDKYKQEFRRHLPITSGGGLPSSMPQELLQQSTTGGHQQSLVDHSGASFVNGMVDPSQQQVPVTNFFSVSDHHQHQVHAATSWQGQHEYTTAGADWTGQLQPQDSQEAAAVAAYQQQQEILLSQNFGLMVNHHQMAAQVAAAAAGFTSSNYFEPPQSHHQASSQHASRPMDPTANQYYPHQAEFVAHPAYLDQLHGTGGAQFSSAGYSAQQTVPTPNQFNPVAQAFVPTTTNNTIDQHATHTHVHKKTAAPTPTPLYQTPPPLLPASMLNRPPPPSNNKSDPNLLVSLNSPPKPLRINRLDPSKHIRSSRHSEGGMVSPSASSRLTDKNTHYHNQQKLPPRFSKPRELNHNFKPPSLVEMQSGTLKRGSNQLPPPPADKGTGLLVFGTSNVMNNLDAERFSKFIGINVRMVAAMRLELFQSAVAEIDPSRDWLVLIHGLGNDARNIALKLKSDQAKAKEADEVANTYCDLIERDLLGASPHIRVLISLLLPRFDFEEKSGLSNPNIVRKVINVAITERLYENPRVELINSDQCLCLDNEEQRSVVMGSDGYHLTHEGFKAMVGNWIKYLSAIIREAFPRQSRTSIPSTQASTPPRAKAMVQNEAPILDSSVDVNALTADDDSDIPNPLLTTETSETVEDVTGTAEDTKIDEEGKVGTGETVPDPFGTYTAPVNVMSPSSRKEDAIVPTAAFDTALPVSDGESDVDDGGIPSLETVEPLSSLMMVSPDSSAANNHLHQEENLQLLSNEETFTNPLMEPETAEKFSTVFQDTEDKPSVTPNKTLILTADKEETSTVTADKEESSTLTSQKEETITVSSQKEETFTTSSEIQEITTVNIDTLGTDNSHTVNGLNNNLDVECIEKVELEETVEVITDAPKPITETEELVKEASKHEEETIEEVVLKPIFKLGRSGGGEVADMNGEEFIDDEYVVNGGGVITEDPLPSMIHCSGPESTDFEPASGIFLEDSYLPSNLESLNLADTVSKPAPTSQHLNNKIENSEPEVTKLTENGSENLIET